MKRRPLVVGNWKMQLSHKAEMEVAKSVKKLVKSIRFQQTDLVICPSFPSLPAVAAEFKKMEQVSVGAQTVHWEPKGALTGSVSISQISPFVTWCIVGHSEQRRLTGESEEMVAARAAALIRHGITPVVCMGETKEERDTGQSVVKVARQVEVLMTEMTRAAIPKLVIAYEPIWAISSMGPTELPDPSEVSSMIVFIRKIVAKSFDNDTPARLRVIYGGSVDDVNVTSYVHEPGVDGVLPGSASLQPRRLVSMVEQIDNLYVG